MELNKFFLILSLLALSNCQKLDPISTVPEAVPISRLASPEPIKTSPVEWKIVVLDNTVYYAMTIDSYKNLSLNLLDIKRYLTEQKNIIKYYESNI